MEIAAILAVVAMTSFVAYSVGYSIGYNTDRRSKEPEQERQREDDDGGGWLKDPDYWKK